MQAIVQPRYGSPDVLELREIDMPTPGPNQVLVKVHTASVNPLDWHYLRGTPLFARASMGFPKPKHIRLGVDLAGWVEAVGEGVTPFQTGGRGFRESIWAAGANRIAEAEKLVPKPAKMTSKKPRP
jgi:NADPH:quinone reductase-like Zn-dependent oxidoreductase